MSGTPYTEFEDFMAHTGPVYLTSPDEVLNEVQLRTTVLAEFLRGKDKSRTIQGGSRIRDVLFTRNPRTRKKYHPGDPFTAQHQKLTETMEIFWRFTYDHLSWFIQEPELQMPEGATPVQAAQVYKNVRRIKEQGMWTSTITGMEEDLWLNPVDAVYDGINQMEHEKGKEIYSIPVFINEEDGTSAGANDPGDGLFTGWTTVQGLNPVTETYFRNRRKQYSYTDPDDSGGNGIGLFDAFQRMALDVQWDAMPMKQEHFETDSMSSQIIVTQPEGVFLAEKLLRDGNDSFWSAKGRNDPHYTPMYNGRRIMQNQTLATATLYDNGTDTWDTATAPGPRYYFINGQYMTPIFHRRFYFKPGEIVNGENSGELDTRSQIYRTWYNLFCNSRQHHGIVYPGATEG